MRPLDRVPSIKLKLGILIVVAVVTSSLVSLLGFRAGVPIWVRPIISTGIALGFVQLLARGMTAPLRQMATAATAMRNGDYNRRVPTHSRDEVGQLAVAFNEMGRQLAEVDRQRRDLVANASHELRTPLAGLQATLENMVDGITLAGEPQLSSLLVQVQRMADLVAQLLDLSQLESGAAAIRRQPVDLSAVSRAAAGDLQALAQKAELQLQVGDPGEIVVIGDEVRLRQVVANLISNAIAHTPAGGRIRVLLSHDDHVRLVVHDDGPGIPEEESDRIFERFYRADRARGAGGGAGLGLSICRWIVELHGGEIRHDSSAGGCRMVVRLPLAPNPTRAPPPYSLAPAPSNPAGQAT
ncbi:MAG: HAMP domain-containing sensor histidine kinase [Euzebya sp.]